MYSSIITSYSPQVALILYYKNIRVADCRLWQTLVISKMFLYSNLKSDHSYISFFQQTDFEKMSSS